MHLNDNHWQKLCGNNTQIPVDVTIHNILSLQNALLKHDPVKPIRRRVCEISELNIQYCTVVHCTEKTNTSVSTCVHRLRRMYEVYIRGVSVDRHVKIP